MFRTSSWSSVNDSKRAFQTSYLNAYRQRRNSNFTRAHRREMMPSCFATRNGCGSLLSYDVCPVCANVPGPSHRNTRLHKTCFTNRASKEKPRSTNPSELFVTSVWLCKMGAHLFLSRSKNFLSRRLDFWVRLYWTAKTSIRCDQMAYATRNCDLFVWFAPALRVTNRTSSARKNGLAAR